jgi:hypothetical protein
MIYTKILLLGFYVFYLLQTYHCAWNPASFQKLSFADLITDPNGFLSPKEKNYVRLYLLGLNKYINYQAKLFILDSIEKEYINNIEPFFTKKQKELRNTISIFIVINTKLMKIRTQQKDNNVKYVDCVDSLICKELLNSLIFKIEKSSNLFGLLDELIYSVQDILNLLHFIIFSFSLLLGLVCCCVNKIRFRDPLKAKLKQIEKITSKNVESKYSNATCIICFNDYCSEDKANSKALLDCGHSFHSLCISKWMVLQNYCPLCRKAIDKSSEPIIPLPSNSYQRSGHEQIHHAGDSFRYERVHNTVYRNTGYYSYLH